MKAPNIERAFIDVEKLRLYALNPEHPEGRHKARVFLAALGISACDTEWLAGQILARLPGSQVRQGQTDQYGRRFEVDVRLTRGSRSAVVRTAWIIRVGEDIPRLATCFVV
ncbi:MAG: hypothetical protein Q8O25_15575 [Sulfurisoma sp.]|nr:hypothetical protein [Sulfurisoma sp.]